MTKWNFHVNKSQNTKENFQECDMKEKLKGLQKQKKRPKFENPRSIPELENIFESDEKMYYNMVGVKEGLQPMGGIGDNEFTSTLKDMANGLQDNDDSLGTLFKKMSTVNELVEASKPAPIVLNKPVDKTNITTALSSSTQNYFLPDPAVANLPTAKLDTTGKNDITTYQDTKAGINSIISRASGAGGWGYLSGDSATISGQKNALEGKINNKKLLNPNQQMMLTKSPGGAPGASVSSSVKDTSMGDSLKKSFKAASDRLRIILQTITSFLGTEVKYGGEKFKSFFVNFRDNYNYSMISIANGLTHNNANVDEVRVFSAETMKFTTVLFTYVFLYNWYYMMFYKEPDQRYKLDINWLQNFNTILYMIFGPSLRALEFIDWFLLDIIPIIKNYITSEPFIFFFMAMVFFTLVMSNFQMAMLTSFLKALSFKSNDNILFTVTSVLVLGYALKLMFWDMGLIGKIWGTKSAIIIPLGMIFFLILVVFYIFFIVGIAAPMAVLFTNIYIVAYSFFAIPIYEMSNTFVITKDIFSKVTGPPGEDGNDDQGSTEGQGFAARMMGFAMRVAAFFNKWIKFTNIFLMEIIILFILSAGIYIYSTQYSSIQISGSTNTSNASSIGTPVNSAFTHLFTWLIIINALLILLTVVRMIGKYFKLKNPESEGAGDNEMS